MTGSHSILNLTIDTTFYFWQPGHHSFHRNGNWAYLYQDLRTKLNTLVTDLNTRLQTIANTVSQDFSEPKVLFADPNPAFKGHRFCEPGVTEPDPSNTENWLFLASWPDDSLPGTTSGTLARLSEATGQALHHWTVPDEATCASTHDRGNLTACQMTQAGIAANTASGIFITPVIDLPDGTNISVSEVGWMYPTKWAKTFHPRSLGHLGYRDLVRGTWVEDWRDNAVLLRTNLARIFLSRLKIEPAKPRTISVRGHVRCCAEYVSSCLYVSCDEKLP
jgi:hypothetical protein